MYDSVVKLFYWACVLILAVNAGTVLYLIRTIIELEHKVSILIDHRRR